MTPEYRFQLSDEYFLTASSRIGSKPRSWYSTWWARLLFVGWLALNGVGQFAWGRAGLGALLLATAVFAASTPLWAKRFEDHVNRRRVRRLPVHGQHCRIRLSEHGVDSETGIGSSSSKWSGYVQAVRHVDGFVLLEAPRVGTWLPDAALGGASVGEVERLLRDHVRDFRVAPGAGDRGAP